MMQNRARLPLLVAASLLLLLVTSAVYGHAQLVSSDPEPGTTLDFPPPLIKLEFDEPLGDIVQVQLIEPSFLRHQLEVTVDGNNVTAAMPAVGGGEYTVQYDVSSADGHPVSGNYKFAVELVSTGPPSIGTNILIFGTALLIAVMLWLHFRSRARMRAEVRAQQRSDRDQRKTPRDVNK